MFLDLKPHEGGAVAFGGIGKGKISGIGKIGILLYPLQTMSYMLKV